MENVVDAGNVDVEIREKIGAQHRHRGRRQKNDQVDRGDGEHLQRQFSLSFPQVPVLNSNATHRENRAKNQQNIGEEDEERPRDDVQKPIETVEKRIIQVTRIRTPTTVWLVIQFA